MSWGAVITGGAAIVGGAIASSGAKSAAKAQSSADQAAIDEQRRQFDITQRNLAPYQTVGTGALNQLAGLYGIPQYSAPQEMAGPAVPQSSPGLIGGLADKLGKGQVSQFYGSPSAGYQSAPGTVPASAPDFSSFYNSPDYKFGYEQGIKGVEGSAAARGGLYSGQNLKAVNNYASGYASQQYGNYANRLAALAGIGQTATNSLAGFGAQASGNIGSLLSNQGDARASGIAGSANALGGALGTLGGVAADYFRNRNSPTQAFNYRGPQYGSYV